MLKTINRKIILILIIIMIPFALNLFFLFNTLESIENDGVAINLAGSQRMRTMLLGMYTLDYVNIIEAGKDSQSTSEVLRTELDKYNKIMDGLIDGDESLGLKKNNTYS